MLMRTINPVAVTVYSNPTFSDRTFIFVVVAQQPYSGLDRLVEVSLSHHTVGILWTRGTDNTQEADIHVPRRDSNPET